MTTYRRPDDGISAATSCEAVARRNRSGLSLTDAPRSRVPVAGLSLFDHEGGETITLQARPVSMPIWPPVCATCNGPGVFGFGRFMREGRSGTWYCQDHKGDAR